MNKATTKDFTRAFGNAMLAAALLMSTSGHHVKIKADIFFTCHAVSKPEDESKDLWAIDYSKLTVALTKAMQEQQLQLEEQKKEIELLKLK